MKGVRFVERRTPTFHAAKVVGQTKVEHKVNPSNRFLSIEIEVAGCKVKGKQVNNAVEKWHHAVVRDGSLPSAGFEINTAPASGDKFVASIKEMCAALEEQKAFVTDACGAHCHIDCRDMKFGDLRKLMLLHGRTEQALYAIIAPNRARSQYCTPSTDWIKRALMGRIEKGNNGFKKELFRKLYNNEKPKEGRKSKGAGHRYASMNIQSWMFRGTVENRMHHGSVEAEHLINWGILMAAMCDFAMQHSERDLVYMKEGALDLLLRVSPTEANREWIKSRVKHFHPEGIRFADNKIVTFVTDPPPPPPPPKPRVNPETKKPYTEQDRIRSRDGQMMPAVRNGQYFCVTCNGYHG
jgi:hypothetical protein